MIKPLQDRPGVGVDDVRLTDRFFLGEGQIRGFDIRGVGPRVLRQQLDLTTGEVIEGRDNLLRDDALGGNAFYIGRAELEIPLGSGARELGLRPSVFVDVGALFNVADPPLLGGANGLTLYNQDIGGVVTQTLSPTAPDGTPNTPAQRFREVFLGDTASPRVSVGVGVNWNSPFGPFRIDFARVLKSAEGDDVKSFSFNVGTQF